MQKLIFTLPVYNEAFILEKNVGILYDWCKKHCQDFDWQIIIANNGSTDDTLIKANKISNETDRISVFHTDKKGRGQVLRSVWLGCDADFYIYMDIDLAVDLKALHPLIRALMNGYDVAIGSRFVIGSNVKRSVLREITSRVYNLLTYLIVDLKVKDAQCGFKGITRKIRDSVLSKTGNDGWFFDTEILAYAQAQGLRILEIPVDWVETRTKGRKSRVNIISTICNYVWNLICLRLKLKNDNKDFFR